VLHKTHLILFAAPRPWLLIGLIALGGIANLVRVPQKNAWNKYSGNKDQMFATFINASKNPLVLFPPKGHQYDLLTLGYMLDPHVRLASTSQTHHAPDGEDLFRFQNSDTRPAIPIEPGSELVLKTDDEELWRIPRNLK